MTPEEMMRELARTDRATALYALFLRRKAREQG